MPCLTWLARPAWADTPPLPSGLDALTAGLVLAEWGDGPEPTIIVSAPPPAALSPQAGGGVLVHARLQVSTATGQFSWASEEVWVGAGESATVPCPVPVGAFREAIRDSAPRLLATVVAEGAPLFGDELPGRFVAWPDGPGRPAVLLDWGELASVAPHGTLRQIPLPDGLAGRPFLTISAPDDVDERPYPTSDRRPDAETPMPALPDQDEEAP